MMQLLVEVIFDMVCGWVGHTTVKLLTLGRVDLDWGEGSDSVVARWIGLFMLFGLTVLAFTLRPHLT